MLIISFLMIVISTFLNVPGEKLPRFHVEAWLPTGTVKWTIHQTNALPIKRFEQASSCLKSTS